MKILVEFGNRGGAHTENLTVINEKAAVKLAALLVMAFANDPHYPGTRETQWHFGRHLGRATWQSRTHFVAITKIDGRMRGPASAGLWRKSEQPPLSEYPQHST